MTVFQWVRERVSSDTSDEEVIAIARAMHFDDDSSFGQNWDQYLATLPEHLVELI